MWSNLEFWIALDAPEGGVAFSYFHAAQVFARERNWGGVKSRVMGVKSTLIDWPWTKQLEEWLQTCNAWMRRAVYVTVGAFDGTPPTDVVTNSTYPTHVHKLVPIHCLEERPRARTLYRRFVEARRCFAQLEERPTTIACHCASVLELISCHSGEHLRRTAPEERWSGYFCVILRESAPPPPQWILTHPCVVQ